MGGHVNQYQLVSALFVRLLGVCYLVAFVSIAVQINGLVGSDGILPIQQELNLLAATHGPERFFRLPSLLWLSASDRVLIALPVAGVIVSILILLNRLVRPALVLAFVFYLSMYYAGQVFMNFQWDMLLLEAGFLAIFLTPDSRVVILLFRWLLFRLRFMSGLSKLTSQDPGWSSLTALNYYFEVQPLPSPLAWYAQQFPDWLLRLGTVATLFIELVVPFMMFLPRRWRFIAAWLTILWQVLIILTSNHNWFNFLTIFLCLFLFDDRALQRVLPSRVSGLLHNPLPTNLLTVQTRRTLIGCLAGMILFASAVQLSEVATMQRSTPWARGIVNYMESFRVVNKYHVFPTMKTARIELEIWGSRDGKEWRRYEFRYRPGDPAMCPAFIVPHQPRLDWMMWFVTLHPNFMPWFERFVQSLLSSSPAVTALLTSNPFADAPPNIIRIDAWRYRFTNAEQRSKTGMCWQREYLGPFTPLPLVIRR